MNFLQLCQQLAHECGVNGPGPTTVVGQTASIELGRIVNWVNQAWVDLQGRRNWSWMWVSGNLVITSGQSTIAGTLAPVRYDQDSFYYDDGSATGRLLEYMPWDLFRPQYRVLNSTDNVTAWTVRPDLTLAFNAAVSVNKNVYAERWTNPVEMAADADIPGLPTDLHMLIVWRAMIKYAGFDEAGIQRQIAVDEHNRLWETLLKRCLPQMRMGGPLGDE